MPRAVNDVYLSASFERVPVKIEEWNLVDVLRRLVPTEAPSYIANMKDRR